MNPLSRLIRRGIATLAILPLMAAAQDILVGQVAPLSGVLADTGKEMVLGVKIYIDHVNAQGGVNGRKIRHIVRDDGYVIAETVKHTRELIDQEKVVALIGFAGTGNLAEVLKQNILAEADIALVAPYTGGEALRGLRGESGGEEAGWSLHARMLVRPLARISRAERDRNQEAMVSRFPPARFDAYRL